VSGPLYARAAAWAREQGLPLAVHIAESAAEREFVSRGAGPFAEAWQAREIPLLDDPTHLPPSLPPASPSSVAWLDCHGVLGNTTLCIHAIQLDGADIQLLADRGVSIAHCPVSNAAHGHGTAPLAALRGAGLRVGIGTDSEASVGRLDLLREARAAQQLAGLSTAESLALATIEGARALGLERQIGTLSSGKWGDVVAVRARGASTAADAMRAALHSAAGDVLLTVLGGRVVHRGLPP
jgi:5-methylthioadenosine/S-adenosylhomocysteine deaminase